MANSADRTDARSGCGNGLKMARRFHGHVQSRSLSMSIPFSTANCTLIALRAEPSTEVSTNALTMQLGLRILREQINWGLITSNKSLRFPFVFRFRQSPHTGMGWFFRSNHNDWLSIPEEL